MQRSVLIITLALFGVLSAAAIWEHGYLGIFAHQLTNLAGAQVLADLAIALMLVLAWMWRDARATGRNIWPWFLLTLTCGSFGPLIYLLTRAAKDR